MRLSTDEIVARLRNAEQRGEVDLDALSQYASFTGDAGQAAYVRAVNRLIGQVRNQPQQQNPSLVPETVAICNCALNQGGICLR